ncbi:Alpha/Beta hydrolase fold [Amanita muscaria]
MSFCDDCFKGVTHKGIPTGKWERIGNVDCYVAIPKGDYPEDKVVLYLCDVFGPSFENNQLLCDDFANNGFKIIAPDYFSGDPIPLSIFEQGETFDRNAWKSRHGPEQTRPLLDKVIPALKEQGVKRFGATGYCFGARYVFDLAFDHVIDVSVVAHPSQLKIPEDLEKYASTAKAPLLINSCTDDAQFPLEAQAKADEIFGNDKFTPGYVREYFDGCSHGFAVRGDMSNPKVKAGKEGAFKASIEWFRKYL